MSELILYGAPMSTYVWSARMACVEKGVPHRLESRRYRHMDALQSPEHLALHPFGKMPAMRHGDLVLYETAAICRYVDAAFDGPPLQPAEPAAVGRMEQWIGVLNAYVYDDLVRRCILQYAFPSGPDGAPNRAVIDRARANMERDINVLDAAYADGDFLASGEVPTIADLLAAPILSYFAKTPEGEALMAGAQNVSRALTVLQARPSFTETTPPPLPSQATARRSSRHRRATKDSSNGHDQSNAAHDNLPPARTKAAMSGQNRSIQVCLSVARKITGEACDKTESVDVPGCRVRDPDRDWHRHQLTSFADMGYGNGRARSPSPIRRFAAGRGVTPRRGVARRGRRWRPCRRARGPS